MCGYLSITLAIRGYPLCCTYPAPHLNLRTHFGGGGRTAPLAGGEGEIKRRACFENWALFPLKFASILHMVFRKTCVFNNLGTIVAGSGLCMRPSVCAHALHGTSQTR